MLRETHHLSDREFLLTADEELAPRRLARLRAHLDGCPACQMRLREIADTLDSFIRIRQSAVAEPLPPAAVSRASLKARLAESALSHAPGIWLRVSEYFSAGPRFAIVCMALLIAAMGAWTVRYETHSQKFESRQDSAWSEPMPDRSLTPGVTLPVTKVEVCRAGDSEETHPIPVTTRRKVFQEYRTPESHAAEYEIDFLITPGLGGADDIRNLWLEPYSSTVWNAHVKDQLEDRLHELVCSGDLDLATAQHDISQDWISAYKKYFHTTGPISSRFPATSDDL